MFFHKPAASVDKGKQRILHFTFLKKAAFLITNSFIINSNTDRQGDNMHIDHIGIAVRDLDGAISFYTDILGAELTDRYSNPAPGVETHVAVIKTSQDVIELLSPTSPSSPIAAFLKQKGKGVHHIAYRVPDLDKSISELKEKGMTFLEHTYRTTHLGRRLIYMNPRHSEGVIIELCDYLEKTSF